MDDKYKCPSAPIKKGHWLLGKFSEDNLAYQKELVTIDSQLFNTIKKDGDKTKYRAAMDCATKNCLNWNGNKCTVTDQMSPYLEGKPAPEKHIECSIRSSCRWFHQEGYNACKICPMIKTEFYI